MSRALGTAPDLHERGVDEGLALLVAAVPAEPAARGRRQPARSASWLLLLASAALLTLGGWALVVVLAPVAPEPTPLVSIDYSQYPAGPALADGDASGEVVDGWLAVRHASPGPMYVVVTRVPATASMTVSASMRWPEGAEDASGLVTGGVMLLDDQRAGYALTCGTDGNAYLWVLEPGWSTETAYLPDAGCRTEFTLSLTATGDAAGTLLVVTPDRAVAEWTPANGTREPLTQAGWVSLLEDQGLVVPGLDVARHTVVVPET